VEGVEEVRADEGEVLVHERHGAGLRREDGLGWTGRDDVAVGRRSRSRGVLCSEVVWWCLCWLEAGLLIKGKSRIRLAGQGWGRFGEASRIEGGSRNHSNAAALVLDSFLVCSVSVAKLSTRTGCCYHATRG
jgi:hypothetical protein